MARELFIQSQQAKERVILKGETVIFPLNQAAVAFRISRQKFIEMARNGKSLLVLPVGDQVRVSLISTAEEPQRELWDEMIASFNRVRSEINITKTAYTKLYAKIQQGLSEEWEDDIGLLHLTLYALWERLPEGTQRSWSCMSPWQVRSSIGVAGSTD